MVDFWCVAYKSCPRRHALRHGGATLVSIDELRASRTHKPRRRTNTRILPAQTSRKACHLHPKNRQTAMMESRDVDMSSPSEPPDWNEPQYGGYSRFEMELEVRPCPVSSPVVGQQLTGTQRAVCPVAREPVLSQPPRVAEAPDAAGVRRVPRVPAVLEPPAVPQVSDVSGADAAPPRAAAAGALPAGHYEPGPGAAAGGGGHAERGPVA